MAHILLKRRHLACYLIDEESSHDVSAIDAVVRIVLTSFGMGWHLSRQEPQVQVFRLLGSQRLLQVVCDGIGIDERHVEPLGHPSGRLGILAMRINEHIAHIGLSLIDTVAQFFVVVAKFGLRLEVSSHHAVEEHRYAPPLPCLLDEALEVGIEGGAHIRVSVRLRFLVVVSELDKDIVALFHFFEHLIPPSLIDEAFRGASVHRMVVDHHAVCEEALQHHAPPPFEVAIGDGLVGHGGVANHKDGECRPFSGRAQHQDHCEEESSA